MHTLPMTHQNITKPHRLCLRPTLGITDLDTHKWNTELFSTVHCQKLNICIFQARWNCKIYIYIWNWRNRYRIRFLKSVFFLCSKNQFSAGRRYYVTYSSMCVLDFGCRKATKSVFTSADINLYFRSFSRSGDKEFHN